MSPADDHLKQGLTGRAAVFTNFTRLTFRLPARMLSSLNPDVAVVSWDPFPLHVGGRSPERFVADVYEPSGKTPGEFRSPPVCLTPPK